MSLTDYREPAHEPDDDSDIDASRAPLLDHLVELRQRLIICVVALVAAFALCFAFAGQIYVFLLKPFELAASLMQLQNAGGHGGPFDMLLAVMGLKDLPPMAPGTLKLVFTEPLEFFFAKLKVAGLGAIFLSFPILAWQVYGFVGPGLYKQEKKAFLPFLFASPFLFMLGAAMVYFVMLPFVLWFSLNQQIIGPEGGVSVELLPKVSDYLALVTTLILAFGLCFQLPVVLSLAGLAGLVNAKMLREGRRYAILGVFVLAAVVTPPDPISQLMLAIPICLLYEVAILCVALIERKADAEDEADG